MKQQTNPFNSSKEYRELFLKEKLLQVFPKKEFEGKGIIYTPSTSKSPNGAELKAL